jgi:hypothetical protein
VLAAPDVVAGKTAARMVAGLLPGLPGEMAAAKPPAEGLPDEFWGAEWLDELLGEEPLDVLCDDALPEEELPEELLEIELLDDELLGVLCDDALLEALLDAELLDDALLLLDDGLLEVLCDDALLDVLCDELLEQVPANPHWMAGEMELSGPSPVSIPGEIELSDDRPWPTRETDPRDDRP